MTREQPAAGVQPPTQQPQFSFPPSLPPQRPTGVARVLAFARGLSGKAVVLALAVFGLQAVMPEGRRPSDLIGSFHGSTEKAELNAKRDAQAQYEATLAAARAAAPANYQMETQLSQTQQQVIAGSLETQSSMANLADAACIGGGLLGAVFGQNQDTAQLAQGLKSACGAGDAIRRNMTNTLADTAREGSGVVQRSAPVQQTGTGPLIPVLPYQPPSGPMQNARAAPDQYVPYVPDGRPVPAAAPQR